MRRIVVIFAGSEPSYTFEDREFVDEENCSVWHEIMTRGTCVSILKHEYPFVTQPVFATNRPCIVKES